MWNDVRMIEVRRAGPDDAGELMRLRTVMLESLPGAGTMPDGPWRAEGAAVFRRQLADPADRLAAFVVDRPDAAALAACVVGAIDERLPNPLDGPYRGYVYNVATDPAYRRRGYSRACMDALLRWYDQRGLRVVFLHASPDGRPLYTSLGFALLEDPAMRWVNPAR
jgi:ribosomal protein S18 acetylase RimI-like enzyme